MVERERAGKQLFQKSSEWTMRLNTRRSRSFTHA